MLDGLGRVKAERQHQSGSAYIKNDKLQRALSRTNPARPGDTLGTSSHSYDALERPVGLQQPDGAVATTSYLGAATTIQKEASATRKLDDSFSVL